jgi:hypothetical protein
MIHVLELHVITQLSCDVPIANICVCYPQIIMQYTRNCSETNKLIVRILTLIFFFPVEIYVLVQRDWTKCNPKCSTRNYQWRYLMFAKQT